MQRTGTQMMDLKEYLQGQVGADVSQLQSKRDGPVSEQCRAQGNMPASQDSLLAWCWHCTNTSLRLPLQAWLASSWSWVWAKHAYSCRH